MTPDLSRCQLVPTIMQFARFMMYPILIAVVDMYVKLLLQKTNFRTPHARPGVIKGEPTA